MDSEYHAVGSRLRRLDDYVGFNSVLWSTLSDFLIVGALFHKAGVTFRTYFKVMFSIVCFKKYISLMFTTK
jgi:hypothetical protein